MVTTVRSEDKGRALKKAFPNAKEGQLDYVIVKDVAVEGAFENVIKSDPPFEIVIHTSSPFHDNVKDVKKDFLDPAIIGTTGLLKAVKKSAPTVKRVACLLTYLKTTHRLNISRSLPAPLQQFTMPRKEIVQVILTPKMTGIPSRKKMPSRTPSKTATAPARHSQRRRLGSSWRPKSPTFHWLP